MTHISRLNVVCLESSKITQASEVLVHAFQSDPIFGYFYPNEQQPRLDSLQWFSKTLLHYSQPYSHIYTTPEPLRGIAAWHPPGQPPVNFRLLLRESSGFAAGLELIKFWEFLSLLFKLEDYRKRDMPCLHWYLCMLGVIPRFQSQGIGSALLQPILQQADAEGLPCYLEVATRRAIRFYRHHGFEILAMIRFSDNAPCLWTMKREPLKSLYF